MRRITPRMLVPPILVLIVAVACLLLFRSRRFGFSALTGAVPVIIFAGLLMLLYYHKLLPLLVVSILIPLTIPVTLLNQFRLSEIVIPLFFLVYILQRATRRSTYNRVRFSEIPAPIYVLFVIGFAWYLASGDYYPTNLFATSLQEIQLGTFRSYFSFFIVILSYFFLLSLVREEKHLRMIPKILFWASLLCTIYFFVLIALKLYRTPILTARNWSIKYIGGGRLPVRCIGMSGMGLILFLTALVGEYPKNMKYRIPVMMIAMASLVISGGRGTFVAGIICMLAYLFLKRHFFLFTSASLATVLVAAVIFAFPQVTKAIPTSVQRVFEYSAGTETGAAKSLESRFAVWERSMELIEEKPLTGTGFQPTEEQEYVYGVRDKEELWIEMAIRSGSTHNGYLAYAQVFGVFGFAFFLYLFFSHFIRAGKMYFRHVDPLVLQLSLLLLLTLVARSVILFGGGGGPGKDAEFYLYIGLIQASWFLVLRNQRRPDKDTTAPVRHEEPSKPRLVSALGK